MFTGRCDFSILSFTLALIYSRAVAQHNDFSTSTTVGQLGANVHSTPVNQLLTPTGRQLELPGMRPQAMALSSSGRLLAVSGRTDRKSTRLNSSHSQISYAVFCLKKKKPLTMQTCMNSTPTQTNSQ